MNFIKNLYFRRERINFMERFEKIYSQGIFETTEIWIDKETGVNYLYHKNGNAAGLTPLLDANGKSIVTTKD